MIRPGNRAICLDGAKCATARARRGLSRERMADESKGGLSLTTIKRLERGVPVYFDTARRFASLVGVSLADLAGDSAAPAPAPELAPAPATLAVLPFSVMGGGPHARLFADGLVEDIITRLGRHWFPVISRSSSFRYEGSEHGLERLRLELGVDYVVEGSVRRAGDTVRVSARVTAAESGKQLWADMYDRPYRDIFLLQTALVSTILSQISGVVMEAEVQRRMGRDPADLTAWELALRASWFFHRRTREANATAASLFEQALQKERLLPLAWYGLAMTHQRSIVNQWTPDMSRSLHEMLKVCVDFRREHPDDAGMHVASAYTDVYRGDRGSAMSRLREAIDIDPNATSAYVLYGQTLGMENRPDEAIEQFELAMRLSPRDADRWKMQIGVALCHFVAERYDEMLETSKRTVDTQPDIPFVYGAVAVAMVYLSDQDGARDAVRTMLSLEPNTTVRGLSAIVNAIHPDIAARYVSGLQRAGVPG